MRPSLAPAAFGPQTEVGTRSTASSFFQEASDAVERVGAPKHDFASWMNRAVQPARARAQDQPKPAGTKADSQPPPAADPSRAHSRHTAPDSQTHSADDSGDPSADESDDKKHEARHESPASAAAVLALVSMVPVSAPQLAASPVPSPAAAEVHDAPAQGASAAGALPQETAAPATRSAHPAAGMAQAPPEKTEAADQPGPDPGQSVDPPGPEAQGGAPPGTVDPNSAIPSGLSLRLAGAMSRLGASAQAADKQQLAITSDGAQNVSAPDGMSIASPALAMPVKHQIDDASGPGQESPALVAAAALSQASERQLKASPGGADRASGPEPLTALAAQAAVNDAGAGPGTAVAANPAPALHRAIENTTLSLHRMEATSVSMVLKPDANTQVALHVKWQQGRFEALAVLERGDLATVGAHWSQLQNRLAEQGVRLAPLVASTQHSASFAGNHFSSPKHNPQPAPAGQAPAPNLSRPKAAKPTPRVAAAGNGREWWA